MHMCAFERNEKGMKFNMEKEKLESLIEIYKLPKEEHEVILGILKRKIFLLTYNFYFFPMNPKFLLLY